MKFIPLSPQEKKKRTLLNSRSPMPSTLVFYRGSRLRTKCSVKILTFLDLLSRFVHVYLVCSRNAMDNASKNASDMIGSLQVKYNRGHQAATTNELVDIITSMSLCSLFGFLFM
jgi:hypothetical protein